MNDKMIAALKVLANRLHGDGYNTELPDGDEYSRGLINGQVWAAEEIFSLLVEFGYDK